VQKICAEDFLRFRDLATLCGMIKHFVWVFVGILLVTSAAFAQQIGGGTLNGTVTDPSGAAITNAKVTATQTATGVARTTQSSGAGVYSLSSLPPGIYDVQIEATGFKTAKLPAVDVGVGGIATLDVKMEVGGIEESVSVTAAAPVVETTRSQTSTLVDDRAVAELPINGRNFLDFTLLTPGVSRDLTRYGDISFGGQRGTTNSLLVDGSDSNNVFYGQSTGRSGTGRNPYSFSQDAVQEFQVSSNGYAAEVGRASGGVINVITKSGTNDFHGTAFEFFRDKSINANTWNNNRNNRKKGQYHFNQFGGNIGGPIQKNKAFFFFDYDGQRNTTPNTVILTIPPVFTDPLSVSGYNELSKYQTSYVNGLRNNVYLAKVDYALSARRQLSGRYNASRFNGLNFENTGANSAQEHTGNSDVTTDNIAVSYTNVITPATLFESRFSWTRDNEPGASNTSAPEAQIRQAGTLVMQIGRNNFSPRYANARTFQFVESLSHQRGSHAYKFGFDLNVQKIDNFFPGNFSGSYQFNSYADFATRTPAAYSQGFAGAGTDGPFTQPNVNEIAFYVQDSWRVNDRLTLNYGIRYDLFDYTNPKVKNPDPGLAAIGFDTSRINKDTNNWGSRFGFAYKLDQGGRTVARGGYGIYYGRTTNILLANTMSNNGIQVQTYSFSSNFPTYPNIFSAPPTGVARLIDILGFAPNYVQPLTHQWSLNLERQLGNDYAVTLGYLGVRGEHLTRTRDINLFPALPVAASIANGNPATILTPVTIFQHPTVRPNPNFRRISLIDSGADSIYHGAFIQLTKRFSQNFQVQSSYTFSKVIDDRPDSTAVVVGGSDDDKITQDTLQPNLDRGLGNSDIRHRFVLSGVWDLGYAKSINNRAVRTVLSGFQLSPIVTLQSGRFLSPTIGGNQDLQNDGNTRNDRSPFAGRNTFEAPGYATVDLRVTREVPLYESVRLRMAFEAFNLFNRANFGSINPAVTSIITTQYNYVAATRVLTPNPTFGAPNDTFDPRILQLSAKITF
jgi:outer membrane receptor protein involved in Fe transport